MYCAISGEVPMEPVVSRKTGHLFEKRLIEKALQASDNQCPVTGEELKPEDLLPVACDLAQRPRPLSATSLPAMMAMFQNEWDDLVVESHATAPIACHTAGVEPRAVPARRRVPGYSKIDEGTR